MARVPLVSNTENPKRKGYDLALDDLLFRTAVAPNRQLTISSAEFPEQQINLTQNPEDITTNVGQIFSRSNFSGGQGLDSAHQRNNSVTDTTRYYDSKGVDVFHGDETSSYKVHLLYTTEDLDVQGSETTFNSTNNYLVRTDNGNLWVVDDDEVLVSTDDGDTWSNSVTATYTITGIVAYGNQIFITAGSGTNAEIQHYDGSSWSIESLGSYLTGYLTGVYYSKGTLFITGKSSSDVYYLWHADPIQKNFNNQFTTSSSNLIVTAENDFTAGVDAGAVTLISNENGIVYSIKDVSGTPTLQGQTKIHFERIHSLAAAEGIIFIGTQEVSRTVGRFYRADLTVADDLYVLANRQLIKEWIVSGKDTCPHSMFVSRDSVYMGVHEADNEMYLWRYYLPTAGLARDLKTSGNGLCMGITQANGKFVISSAGSDLYKETSTYESSGYIILPNADFFTSEDKQWVGVEVEHNELGNGKKVEIYVTTTFDKIDEPDSASWELIGESVSGTGGVEYQLNRNARYINAKVILEPNVTATESPEFRGISIRALPRPELVVVTVPINLSDQIERPRRKAFKVKNLGEVIYQTLKQKEGDSVTLTLYEPSEIIRGVVESVQYPISERSEVGSVTQFCLLRVRGVRAEDAATIVTRLLGVGQLGVAGLG